jgi:hypothetical protein
VTAEPRAPLFRPEAVEHHARGSTERRTLDLGERRVAWGFRALLVAVAAILVAGFTLHADTETKGPVTVADGRVGVVRVPIGALRRLSTDDPVTVHVAGTDVRARITQVGRPEASGDSAVVPLAVVLDAPVAPGATGDATVRLGRHTLAQLLLGRSR